MRVVDLVSTNVSSAKEGKIYEMILYGIEASMNERILVGMVGILRTNNNGTQGYYWAEGLLKAYIKNENTVMKVVDLAYTAFVE